MAGTMVTGTAQGAGEGTGPGGTATPKGLDESTGNGPAQCAAFLPGAVQAGRRGEKDAASRRFRAHPLLGHHPRPAAAVPQAHRAVGDRLFALLAVAGLTGSGVWNASTTAPPPG